LHKRKTGNKINSDTTISAYSKTSFLGVYKVQGKYEKGEWINKSFWGFRKERKVAIQIKRGILVQGFLTFFCSVDPLKMKKPSWTSTVSIGVTGGHLNPCKIGLKGYITLFLESSRTHWGFMENAKRVSRIFWMAQKASLVL